MVFGTRLVLKEMREVGVRLGSWVFLCVLRCAGLDFLGFSGGLGGLGAVGAVHLLGACGLLGRDVLARLFLGCLHWKGYPQGSGTEMTRRPRQQLSEDNGTLSRVIVQARSGGSSPSIMQDASSRRRENNKPNIPSSGGSW